MSDARAKFNDRTDPSFQFEDQCTTFRILCPECGNRFPSGSRSCPHCGAIVDFSGTEIIRDEMGLCVICPNCNKDIKF